MSSKKKIFEIIVIGSGLSSLSFIDSYLAKNRNKSINIISPADNNNYFENEFSNKHVDKFLPPQMKNNLKEVKNYFFYNKIKVNKSSKIFGSLKLGGLSNYWGLQIDSNILKDITYLSNNTRTKIKKSFIDIFNKFKLLGKLDLDKKIYKRDYNVNYFDTKILKSKNTNFMVSKPILGFSKKNKNKFKNIDLNFINENKDKLTAKNYYNFFLKNKKIILHNYVVNKIYKKKNKIIIECENKKEKKIFSTKKLVLGCGTIVTTKLILEFLKFKNEVKIMHHPRLLSLFLSKYNNKNNMKFMPSTINVRDSKKLDEYVMDFRPGNNLIVNSIIEFNKFLLPFKFILNFLKGYMVFSNIFLHSKYSNLFMKISKNSIVNIYSKNKKVDYVFKKIHKNVFKFLSNEKLIFPISYNYFPGFGADFHYFGTIPMEKGNKKLSVTEKCQLKSCKNIYIIDGSVMNFKSNKYPLGLIMANARRIGKEIK